ncbi:hypothetical protein SKAU_G00288600 [Synaphobranchus kaupii]|uniref:Interleukin-4 receptor alpha N-terminal domain-containing protein n=1 Tax=Synaphobranchus kaupii TaxID=118154 RepID=A0A9Q1IL37_SYNKA|nr:hypothetical protein SKAU_G00288600 [Synaphobranchus kaupii]
MLFRIMVFLLELLSLSYAHLNISNLNCFNDYEETMVCEFTSGMPLSCSSYSLDFVSQHQEHFMCTFMNSSRKSNSLSRCRCTVKMPLMVNIEKYTRNLLEGGRVINTRIITAFDNIKPRAPEILSVMPMGNGNYNIMCKKHYDEQSFLYDSLEIQLSYGKKGEADTAWRTIPATLPSQEIVGSHLEPSSEYIVKARSHSPQYNTQFSDWSREVEWTVPASVQNVWEIIIPVLSVLLIIVIYASYQGSIRLKTQWWDRIPTPNDDIKYMLPGNPKVFTPKVYDPWSIHPDALTIATTEEKPWAPPGRSECDQEFSYKNVPSCQSAIDSGVGSHTDSQTGLTGSVGSCSSSQWGYRNVLCTRWPATPFQESASCGTPCSVAPLTPASDSCQDCGEHGALGTPSLLAYLHKQLHAPDSFREGLRIPIDCEYQPCNIGLTSSPPAEGADPTCSFNTDILDALLQNTCALTCGTDDGYQSFAQAIARTAQSQATFPACRLDPCEEGYQAVQTVLEHREHQTFAPGKADMDGPESWTVQRAEPPTVS